MGRDNTGNKKLKIAMLGHKRVPSREGGIEIVVEELASRMVAEGHSVTEAITTTRKPSFTT